MRRTIRFLLGEQARDLNNVSPTLTVLEYLRTIERACGTKEGCAEGDCGACTVVLAEPHGDGLRYQAVNACILFVPSLDGKQLLTVEHLRADDGTLHPVQQAMVDYHASQCGFCTPGFVMSLFALYHAGRDATRREINETLAGNLCRCTGYRPIVDAARAATATAPTDRFAAHAPRIAARLHALATDEPLALDHDGQLFWRPTTLAQLAALRADHPEAVLLAGGTDVGLWVTKLHRDMPEVIAVDGVRDLAMIEESDGALRIGAGATYEAALPAIERNWPDFGAMIRRLGSRQIRNRGTLGGNIGNASPIGDTMPLLIALGATLVLNRAGLRRTLPIEDFFQGYRRTALAQGEFIERVDIALPEPGQIFRAYKVSKRPDEDISSVCAAFALELDGDRVASVRVGYGGVAATPARARATEKALSGRVWSHGTVADAMRTLDGEFAPISDMRSSAAYRKLVARNLLQKFFLETTGDPSARTRLWTNEAVPA